MTTVTDNSIEQINAALLNLKKDIVNSTLTEDNVKKIAASTKSSSTPDLSGYATKGYVQAYVAENQPDLNNYATKTYVDNKDATINSRIDNLVIPTIETAISTSSPESVVESAVQYYRFRVSYTISKKEGIYKWINAFQSRTQIVTVVNNTGGPIRVIISNGTGDGASQTLPNGSSFTTGELFIKWDTAYATSVAPTCITIVWSPNTNN